MKLIMCPKCADVLRLRKRLRYCRCGASCGRQRNSEARTEIGGDAIPIGVDNAADWPASQERLDARDLENLSARVIPEDCPALRRIDCPSC